MFPFLSMSQAPHSRLLTALPNPHFAVRCATLSAVALRVFCIDRAFAYDKVVLPSRASRSSDTNRREREPPATAATSSSLSRRGSAASASVGAGVTALAPRQRAPPRGFYTDKGEFDDDEEDRGRRSSGRKRKGEEENEEDYQDDEGGDDQEAPLPRTWECSVGFCCNSHASVVHLLYLSRILMFIHACYMSFYP
jgi:hypothetical protein